jgi:hypothetical protein
VSRNKIKCKNNKGPALPPPNKINKNKNKNKKGEDQ